MRDIKNEYVILSAQLKECSPFINDRRHETLVSILNDLGAKYSVTSGYYDKFTETSVLITLEPNKGYHEGFFSYIASHNFNQESILYIDKNNTAVLIN